MKLPQISGLKLIKILNKKGFKVIRQKGSHIRLERRINEKIIRLTVPLHNKLKKGTLSRILKDSKISEKEFKKYF